MTYWPDASTVSHDRSDADGRCVASARRSGRRVPGRQSMTAGDRWSPRHRPPIGLRVIAAMLGVGVLLFNAALMVSDRAPGFLGNAARRLSARLDAGTSIRSAATDPRLPESDALVHIAVWALAIGLVGIAVWTWRGLLVGGVVVFGCSVVVEISQERLSDSRNFEMSDVAANATGVVVGASVVAVCYLTWSALARLFGKGL